MTAMCDLLSSVNLPPVMPSDGLPSLIVSEHAPLAPSPLRTTVTTGGSFGALPFDIAARGRFSGNGVSWVFPRIVSPSRDVFHGPPVFVDPVSTNLPGAYMTTPFDASTAELSDGLSNPPFSVIVSLMPAAQCVVLSASTLWKTGDTATSTSK